MRGTPRSGRVFCASGGGGLSLRGNIARLAHRLSSARARRRKATLDKLAAACYYIRAGAKQFADGQRGRRSAASFKASMLTVIFMP